MDYIILYNPLSKNGKNKKIRNKVLKYFKKKNYQVSFLNILEIKDLNSFLTENNRIKGYVIIGGDGTISRVSDKIKSIVVEKEIYIYKAGTGNDFARSIKDKKKIIRINKYLKKLPTLKYDNNDNSFINGIGIGLDALVCNKVNNSKSKKNKYNYFKNALKAFKEFRPFKSEICINKEKNS